MSPLKYFSYTGFYEESFNLRYNKDFKLYQFNMNVYSERLKKTFLMEGRFTYSNNKTFNLRFYQVVNDSYLSVSHHSYKKIYDFELKEFYYNGFKFNHYFYEKDIIKDINEGKYVPYDSTVIELSPVHHQFDEIDGDDIIYISKNEDDDEYYAFEFTTTSKKIYVPYNKTMDPQEEVEIPVYIDLLDDKSYGYCRALNKYIIPLSDIDKINEELEKIQLHKMGL